MKRFRVNSIETLAVIAAMALMLNPQHASADPPAGVDRFSHRTDDCTGVCWHNSNYTQFSCADPDLDPDDYPDWSPSSLGCTGTYPGYAGCSGTDCGTPEEQEQEEEQLLADGSVSHIRGFAAAFVSYTHAGWTDRVLRSAVLERSPCTGVVISRYYRAAASSQMRRAAHQLTL